MEESWKKIPKTEGLYSASTLGRIRSERSGKLLSLSNRRGYLRASLHVGKKVLEKNVHRYVLEAFAGPCPKNHEAAHLNGIKTDNRIENLRWTTHKENCFHRVIHGTQARGSNAGTAKFLEKDAENIISLRRVGYRVSYIANKYEISRQTVTRITSGRSWKFLER